MNTQNFYTKIITMRWKNQWGGNARKSGHKKCPDRV